MLCKINVDFSEIDLEKLLKNFDRYNCEICLDNDCIYVYSNQIQQTRQFSILLEDSKIKNFFIKQIVEKPSKDPQNFITSWLIEKLTTDEVLKVEAENQKALKQMLNNIKKASDDLEKRILEKNGGAANG